MRVHLLLSLGLSLSAAACASAQCGPFFADPSVVLTFTTSPRDLIAADLDRDGVPDLVYSTTPGAGGSVIHVMHTNAAGVPELRQSLTTSGAPAVAKCVIADVNRDGIVDILATQSATGSLLVYLGIGDGTLNPSAAAFAVGNAPTAVVVADLNNDGRIDAITCSPTDGTYSVLMGNGDGTFQPRVAAPAGIASPNLLALVDLNGDARLDLILSGLSQNLAVRFGNGNGTFGPATTYVSVNGANTANRMAVADVTGDGVPDVLRMNSSQDDVYLFKGRANGTFASEQAINFALSGTKLRSFDVADFNVDGKADLALTYAEAGNVSSQQAIALGNGDGTFAAPMTWPQITPAGSNCLSTVADLNLDTHPDVAYVDGVGTLVTMLSTSAGIKLGFGQSNVVHPAGTNAAVSVFAEGTGLQYSWFKNDKPLVNTTRVFSTGPILELNNLNESDAGVYKCRIFNACSSITTTSYVHVLPASNSCPADFNNDGFINFEDFDAFVVAFEQGC